MRRRRKRRSSGPGPRHRVASQSATAARQHRVDTPAAISSADYQHHGPLTSPAPQRPNRATDNCEIPRPPSRRSRAQAGDPTSPGELSHARRGNRLPEWADQQSKRNLLFSDRRSQVASRLPRLVSKHAQLSRCPRAHCERVRRPDERGESDLRRGSNCILSSLDWPAKPGSRIDADASARLSSRLSSEHVVAAAIPYAVATDDKRERRQRLSVRPYIDAIDCDRTGNCQFHPALHSRQSKFSLRLRAVSTTAVRTTQSSNDELSPPSTVSTKPPTQPLHTTLNGEKKTPRSRQRRNRMQRVLVFQAIVQAESVESRPPTSNIRAHLFVPNRATRG
jgi:hypothetical protein